MLLPVNPDFCTGIFLVFSIFFPTSSISLQLYMTFHIFFVITSLFFFSPLIWFFPSVLPVPLSPISFTISISYPRLALLFRRALLTFSPPFPISLFLVIANLQRSAIPTGSSAPFDHPLASASKLLQQLHLPQLTQRLQRG